MSKKVVGVLELLLTAFIWGIAFVAQSVGMKYIGPFTFNCVRFFIGGVILIPVIIFLNNRNKKEIISQSIQTSEEKKKYTVWGGILCGILLCSASTFQQMGICRTSVGKAGFITALYIIIVPLLGIFLHKGITILLGISTIIAMLGFYLLCISGQIKINSGDILVLICAFIFSLHILVIDYFSPKGNGVAISCIQFFVSALISGVFMFLFEKPVISQILSAYVPILYAGVLSCGVAYTLQIIGQQKMEPTVASLILSLESVFSALAGWFILKQGLSMKELIGCMFVFIAVILAQLPHRMN